MACSFAAVFFPRDGQRRGSRGLRVEGNGEGSSPGRMGGGRKSWDGGVGREEERGRGREGKGTGTG